MTSLVTMVADLNLKEVPMKDKFVWFNGNVNNFVEFADDGAAESKEGLVFHSWR